MIKFVDLFAGIGGIRLGFESALRDRGIDCNCVLSSEIDPNARETYRQNFDETPSGDIRLIDDIPPFDFLLAGFPCQPFSYAGKQKGFGDTRGTLFFEIERILGKYQPQNFLLENVRGLTTHDNGRTFATVVEKLELLGYGVRSLLLNSSDFGVPQNRVRVYILGARGKQPTVSLSSNRGASDSHQFKRNHNSLDFFSSGSAKLVRDVLEHSPAALYDCSTRFNDSVIAVAKRKRIPLNGLRLIDFRNGNSIHSWEIGLKGICSQDEIRLMNALIANRRKKIFGSHQDGKALTIQQIETFFEHPNLSQLVASLVEKKYLRIRDTLINPVSGNMSFEVFKILDPDSISITLVSSDAHKLGIFQNNRIRRLTPRECARIQGYPDSFKLHANDAAAYHQLGNSVSVPVIEHVIADFLDCNRIPKIGDAQVAESQVPKQQRSKTPEFAVQ
jgi:DNA (cytosine-5)-methyltransferase 1